jgi:RecA-family ATPase
LTAPPSPREWLLEGLLYKGQITMFFGPPGIRKTLLLMDACAALALGQNWLVRRMGQEDHNTLATFHTTRPARILWLDYDNGEFETQIRIRAALAARNGLGQGHFYYLSEATPWLALDNASHVRRVIGLAQEVQADVIVIDALGMVLGAVDENAPEVAGVIARLKEIRAATGAALIAIHHPSKSGAQTAAASTYNAAGSAKFSNFFEWTVELRAGEEANTIVAEVVKNRGWAKVKRFAASFEYEHFGKEQPGLAHELERFRFYPAPLQSKSDKRTTLVAETALALLAEGERNQMELVAAVKQEVEAQLGEPVGEATIRAALKTLVAGGDLLTVQSAPRQPILYRLAADRAWDDGDER